MEAIPCSASVPNPSGWRGTEGWWGTPRTWMEPDPLAFAFLEIRTVQGRVDRCLNKRKVTMTEGSG